MRIICPNCTAAYDIPANAVPANGREVQCSRCTHAWYQLPPAPAASNVPLPLSPDNAAAPRPSVSVPEPAPDQSHEDEDSDIGDPDMVFAPSQRRKLDPSVLEVLRAEAKFEASARQRAQASHLETQPDLGLPQPAPPARKPGTESIRARLARIQEAEKNPRAKTWEPGEETAPEAPGVAAEHLPPRTVSPRAGPPKPAEKPTEHAAETPTGEPAVTPKSTHSIQRYSVEGGLPVKLSPRELAVIAERTERRGFRWGFGLTCGLTCAALALYLFAPVVVDILPAGAPLFDLVISGGQDVQATLAAILRNALGAPQGPPPG